MMDLSEKGSSSGSEDKKKTCVDCQTTKTPLWRGGPAGPKSLCNACGIRARKRRRALLGLNKGESAVEKKKEKKSSHHHSTHKNNNNNNKNLNVSSKLRLLLGREVLLQRSTMKTLKQRKLGEEEQAAILLMALSCGSIYA